MVVMLVITRNDGDRYLVRMITHQGKTMMVIVLIGDNCDVYGNGSHDDGDIKMMTHLCEAMVRKT